VRLVVQRVLVGLRGPLALSLILTSIRMVKQALHLTRKIFQVSLLGHLLMA